MPIFYIHSNLLYLCLGESTWVVIFVAYLLRILSRTPHDRMHFRSLNNYSKPELSPSKRCTCSGTMDKHFPVDGGMTSFWRSQPDTLDNHRSTESLPESSDIVIVGSGYTGAATAYHCLVESQSAQAKNPSIVILEARQACSGATGRNGESRTYPSLR